MTQPRSAWTRSFGRVGPRAGAFLLVAVVLLGSTAAPVFAECNPAGTTPSFRQFVPQAKRIVVGEVVAIHDGGTSWMGHNSRFTIRVDHVLRGEVRARYTIEDVATQPCGPFLMATKGELIALALDIGFKIPQVDHTIAWIRGTPYDETAETVELSEVFRLVGLQPPDTATAPPRSDHGSGLQTLLLMLIAGTVSTLTWARRLPRSRTLRRQWPSSPSKVCKR